MRDPRSWDESTLSQEEAAARVNADEGSDEYYLVVVEADSSRMFRLPAVGDVDIGRGEVELRLNDNSVSRRHAMISVGAGEVCISDLQSHNGTRVNGERIAGSRQLVSGDIVQICSVTLVFHASVKSRGRTILALDQLRQRADGEIERSLRYRRPLTLVAVAIPMSVDRPRVNDAVVGCMRMMDVVGWASSDLVALIPETDDDESLRAAERLRAALEPIVPDARVGFATCPNDGADVDTLLASARAAAQEARAGQVAPAATAFQTLTIGPRSVIVADPTMAKLYGLIERLASADLPVLIWGETGTGMELAASAVHHWSARKAGPLIALNCAALAESLVESELFGHESGAFTGAVGVKQGLLEKATGGTVFLDEIGELSLNVQAKLLRVLETKRVQRIGDVRERPIDIRIVAATNRNLSDEVKASRFRQDLFFRPSGATLWLPPLRDRRRELAILAQTFLAESSTKTKRPAMTISNEAMQRLLKYRWPGNVRELRNVMDYIAVAYNDPMLEPWHLADRLDDTSEPAAPLPPAPVEMTASVPAKFRPLEEEIRELERSRIEAALQVAGGNQTRAAELISMPLRTFQAKVKHYNLRTARR